MPSSLELAAMQSCQAESFERIERLIRDTAFSGVVHVSFRSYSKPASGLRYSVLSNTTSGAWPIVKELDAALA